MKSRVLLTGLLLMLPSLANADEPVKVTFVEHIAPIVHAKCTMCHRKGQSGPFELLTYEDARASRDHASCSSRQLYAALEAGEHERRAAPYHEELYRKTVLSQWHTSPDMGDQWAHQRHTKFTSRADSRTIDDAIPY